MTITLPSTINEFHESIFSKKYTVTDIIKAYLERIDANKDLNAILTVTSDQALSKAKEFDELILKENKAELLKKYPLFGIGVIYKDMYLTEGIRTTAGSKVLEDFIPPYSATVVEKIESSGGIILGKANCDAWAHGASGENSDYGPTLNPWNKDYVPGGSSSGSAVSVAADLSLISFGTDTGGSIRQPAGFTNTVGFKPTYGAVSRYGVVAMSSSLDTMGHFARNIEDIEKVFEITRGADGKDSTVVDHNWQPANKKFTIGIPKEYFIDGLNPEVRQIVMAAVEEYKKLGVEVVEVSLPNTKYAIDVYYIVQPAEVSSNLGRYDAVRYGNDRSTFGDEAKRRIMLGTYVLSAGYYDAFYLKAMKVRSVLIKDMEEVFKKVDALISPISPTPPFKIGEKSDDPLAMYLGDIFTVSANLIGIPGISIPGGFTQEGLPVGFQLMGPRFSENTLFELGKMYQQVTDWHTKKPKL